MKNARYYGVCGVNFAHFSKTGTYFSVKCNSCCVRIAPARIACVRALSAFVHCVRSCIACVRALFAFVHCLRSCIVCVRDAFVLRALNSKVK